ncbi:DUF1467 family protein [Mongoliimonas terrestris]|uniref:DUF1467 family protein n=1 Tax=Mongoliimonas terrestris TaxID=1709001 RepID=UPI000949A879|nr:DUF1467 family protein [Mongoliimonas terrestris]
MTIGGIGIGSAIAIFFVIWWTVLFVVLPFGVRSQQEEGVTVPGSDPGAPAQSLMRRKLLWTTALAVVGFALFVGIMNSGLTLDMLPGPKPTHVGG